VILRHCACSESGCKTRRGPRIWQGTWAHGRLVVLLFCTNIAGGMIAADRIEQAVLELNLGRVSIGLANYEASMKEPSELLETADRALRAAEEAGGGVELA